MNNPYWIKAHDTGFPDVELALRDPDGLLAVGGDLTPQRLIEAYRNGIFPWYSAGQPVLWWSPDPRTVLLPERFRISRSLRKLLLQTQFDFAPRDMKSLGRPKGRVALLPFGNPKALCPQQAAGHELKYRVTFDTCFSEVVQACAAPRKDDAGTWITPEMVAAYSALHHLGHAHSVEVWHGDDMVGGLYGVALGSMFFAESMFSRRANTSKVALAHLVACLREWNYALVDCQMHTAHLASLGAEDLPRREFIRLLQLWRDIPPAANAWHAPAP
ncbi:MAG: leucyl/phenylalanyl-tRNA--protein transferase [Proteobacteria bacterium]|nr:leucyl/phenylalanyl-tRNA--protein transferase [Pseudomonadota bacterium]